MVQSKKLLQFKAIQHFFLNREDTINQNAFLSSGDTLLLCKQIHGKKVINISNDFDSLKVCDGMITNKSGIVLAIATADCLPILSFTPDIQFIGAIHAGWKGIYKGIINQLIKALKGNRGMLRTAVCAIGPHIRDCCYSVSKERVELLTSIEPELKFWKFKSGKYYVNLEMIVRNQLINEGISKDNIDTLDICTKCNNEYCSYRRDINSSSRMLSLIKKNIS